MKPRRRRRRWRWRWCRVLYKRPAGIILSHFQIELEINRNNSTKQTKWRQKRWKVWGRGKVFTHLLRIPKNLITSPTLGSPPQLPLATQLCKLTLYQRKVDAIYHQEWFGVLISNDHVIVNIDSVETVSDGRERNWNSEPSLLTAGRPRANWICKLVHLNGRTPSRNAPESWKREKERLKRKRGEGRGWKKYAFFKKRKRKKKEKYFQKRKRIEEEEEEAKRNKRKAVRAAVLLMDIGNDWRVLSVGIFKRSTNSLYQEPVLLTTTNK